MPKQRIAVEFEAINREGDIQTVHSSGLTVHGYSVYVRSMETNETNETNGLTLATWVFDSDTVEPAYELAERLSLALAIPLTVRVPTDLIPNKESTPPAGITVTYS